MQAFGYVQFLINANFRGAGIVPLNFRKQGEKVNNMMIYVIMKGCYSDRQVVAATLDRETAEKIKAELLFERHDETVEILTMEDAKRQDKGLPTYLVKFDSNFHFKDMTLEILRSYHKDYSDYPDFEVVKDWDDTECEDCYFIRVKADSAERAKKIACDLIAQYQYMF